MDKKYYKWILWCNKLEKMGYTGLPIVLEFNDKRQEFRFNSCGNEAPKGFAAIGFAPSSLVTSFSENMMRVIMRTKHHYATRTMEDFFDTMIYQPLRMMQQ